MSVQVRGDRRGRVGQLRNAERSNLGTFIGALCFLAGALLLPERTEETTALITTPGTSPTAPGTSPT